MLIQEFSFQELLDKINEPNTSFVPIIKTSDDITKSVLKLANNEGGTVVLGFDRSNLNFPGTTVGADWIHVVVKNDCSPEIEFKIKEMFRADKKAVIIEIQEGLEKPYSLTGSRAIIENTHPLQEEIPKATEMPNRLETSPDIQEPKQEEISKNIETTNNYQKEVLNRREKKAVNYLKKHESISNKEYRDINKVSSKTAHNELAHLIALGYTKQQGEGRLTRYVLIDIEPSIVEKNIEILEQSSIIEDSPSENEIKETDTLEENKDTSLETEPSLEGLHSLSREFPNNVGEIEDATTSTAPSNKIDPEDDDFMSVFNDGVDFIDKLSKDIDQNKESIIQKRADKITRKSKQLNTRVPLFDLSTDEPKLTKTNLRETGVLHSHIPK